MSDASKMVKIKPFEECYRQQLNQLDPYFWLIVNDVYLTSQGT